METMMSGTIGRCIDTFEEGVVVLASKEGVQEWGVYMNVCCDGEEWRTPHSKDLGEDDKKG
jgi:hypothetical protein